jgi:hypothetical protein
MDDAPPSPTNLSRTTTLTRFLMRRLKASLAEEQKFVLWAKDKQKAEEHGRPKNCRHKYTMKRAKYDFSTFSVYKYHNICILVTH